MIIWLASYPKSGNTWLRSIISSLIYDAWAQLSIPSVCCGGKAYQNDSLAHIFHAEGVRPAGTEMPAASRSLVWSKMKVVRLCFLSLPKGPPAEPSLRRSRLCAFFFPA